MITPQTVRELALSLPQAEERDHCGIPSFRVKRAFATLWPEQNWVHLFLTPELQAELIREDPHIFSKVPNKWGDKGATRALLATIDEEIMLSALKMAWRLAVPPKLLAAQGESGRSG